MSFSIGDIVVINRPSYVPDSVSDNPNQSRGVITFIDKDKTARIKTFKTKLNLRNWESFQWLKLDR